MLTIPQRYRQTGQKDRTNECEKRLMDKGVIVDKRTVSKTPKSVYVCGQCRLSGIISVRRYMSAKGVAVTELHIRWQNVAFAVSEQAAFVATNITGHNKFKTRKPS